MNWYQLRRKDEAGVTRRERIVLMFRAGDPEVSWSEIARRAGVSRQRIGTVRDQLIQKGLLTPVRAHVSKQGKEYLDAVDG